MTPWVGWYAAIEDILHTLPESKFADWQLKRLPADLSTLMVGGCNTSDVQAGPGVGVSLQDEPTRVVAQNSSQWKALLIEGDAAGDRPPTCRTSAEPAFTLKTASGGRVHRAFLVGSDSHEAVGNRKPVTVREAAEPSIALTNSASKCRAWLEQGRVVAMTPRALARFMSCPDTYRLPTSKALASTVLGNGFCCLLSEVIMAQLHDYL